MLISFSFGFLVGLLITGIFYLALRVLSRFPLSRRVPVTVYLCGVGVIVAASVLLVRAAQIELETMLHIYSDRSWRLIGFAVGMAVFGVVLYYRLRSAEA